MTVDEIQPVEETGYSAPEFTEDTRFKPLEFEEDDSYTKPAPPPDSGLFDSLTGAAAEDSVNTSAFLYELGTLGGKPPLSLNAATMAQRIQDQRELAEKAQGISAPGAKYKLREMEKEGRIYLAGLQGTQPDDSGDVVAGLNKYAAARVQDPQDIQDRYAYRDHLIAAGALRKAAVQAFTDRANPASQNTAAQVGRGAGHVLAAAPSMMAALPVGVLQMAGTSYESAYTAKENELRQSGETDDMKIAQQAQEAASDEAVKQAPALAAYMVGGKLASGAVAKLLPESSPLVRGLAGAGAAAAANVVTGGAIRKLEGQPFAPNLEQFTGDLLWAGVHGFGEAQGAAAEQAQRARENAAATLEAANMPVTASVVREGAAAKPAAEPSQYEAFGHPEPPRTLPDDHPLLQSRAGDQSPERVAWRESEINKRLDAAAPVPDDTQPVLWVFGGGGGSGKTTIKETLQERGEMPKSNYVDINADDFKTAAPEWEQFKAAGDGRAAEVLHDESSALAKETLRRAMADRKNVVLDGTMGNRDASLATINDARARGYDVRLVGVTIDPLTALDRAMGRGEKSNRYVPPGALLRAHKGFNAALESYLGVVDTADIYDNSGEAPLPVLEKRNGVVDVKSPEAYAQVGERGNINEKARSRDEVAPQAPAGVPDAGEAGRVGDREAQRGEGASGAAADGDVLSVERRVAPEHLRGVPEQHQAAADLLHTLKEPGDGGPVETAKQAVEESKGMQRKQRGSEAGSTTLIGDVLDKVADAGHAVYRAGMDFATWSAEMLRAVGEKVRPHLKSTWDTINRGPFRPGYEEAGSVLSTLRRARQEVTDPKKFGDFERAVNKLSATMQRTFLETRDIVSTMKKAVPDPVKREAIGNWIEAKGEAKRTGETQEQVLDRWAATNRAQKYQKGYDAARTLTPDEQAKAAAVEKFFADQLAVAKKWGVVNEGRENYVNRVFKPRDADARASALSGGSIKTSASFAKHRFYDTAFEAEQPATHPQTGAAVPGLEHVTKDIGEKMALYAMELNKVVAQRQLVADLSKATAPDGRPLVFPTGSTRTVTDAAGEPQSYLSFPGSKADVVNKISGEKEPAHDYKPITNGRLLQRWKWVGEDADGRPILQQSDLAVHPDYVKHLDNITKGSRITEWYNSPGTALRAIPKALVKGIDTAQSWAKEAMFAFSGFHYVTIAEHAAEHRINPLGELAKSVANLATMPVKPLHDMVARSLNLDFVDYNNPKVQDWMQHALMVAPDHVSAHSFMEGVGGTTALQKVPGLGKVAHAISEDLFTRFIPALKLRMANTILGRNVHLYSKELAAGKVSLDDVKYLTSHQVNAALSHLNLVDLGRSPTLQHILRLTTLAPDFTESRVRFLSQGAKALLGGKAGVEQLSAIAFGAGLLYATCRVINGLLNDGDTKNDLKHAFSIVNGQRSYEIRSVQGDLVKAMSNWGGFAQGRLAPIGKFMLESLSGVNYRGEKVSTGQALGELAASYIPISMRELPGLRELTQTTKQNPVSAWEQFLGTIGVHSSRYSPISETYQRATEWRKDNAGKVKGVTAPDNTSYPTSKYQQLRYALEDGDMDRARAEWQKLKATEPDASKLRKGFETSVQHPFTGSTATDEKFARSLDSKDKALYREAVRRRADIVRRFETVAR